MCDDEREYYEYERDCLCERGSTWDESPWLGTDGDDARKTEELAWQFLFIYLSSLLPHTHIYKLSWTHTLVPHQLVQQEGAIKPKRTTMSLAEAS